MTMRTSKYLKVCFFVSTKKNPQRASAAGRGLLEYNSINLKN